MPEAEVAGNCSWGDGNQKTDWQLAATRIGNAILVRHSSLLALSLFWSAELALVTVLSSQSPSRWLDCCTLSLCPGNVGGKCSQLC